ncbi:hypothetical protein ATANTOWER_025771 [Ataeniobius toweri]|uniref:Uncharacterized protein n=1 Tax=Ataeniobius toweri TaxID=208326 RepID=A0ABU7BSG1_9TELE|nr:hypothetical protein [Ataeniobius toweri]
MEERTTLMAGVAPLQAPTEAEESLLPAKGIQGPQPVPSTCLQEPAAAADQGEGGQCRPFGDASIAAPSTSSSTQDAAPPLLATTHATTQATTHATHVPKSTA